MEAARTLDMWESEVVHRMLAADFGGAPVLEDQLADAKVRRITEYRDNYGSIAFIFDDGERTKAALVDREVPVEAEAVDEDGMPIYFLLHVVDGYLDELEIYRADARPIRRVPDPRSLVVIVRST